MISVRNQSDAPRHGAGKKPVEIDTALRILLADDHDLVRETIASFLSHEGSITVHCVGTLDDALKAFCELVRVDLVLLDLQMPGMDGLRGLERMLRVAKDIPVAMMSGAMQPHKVKQAISLGASGYLPKSMSSRSMASAVQFIAAGEKYLPYDFQHQVADTGEFCLKPREMDVLRGLAEGLSNKEIANLNDLQEVTVKFHVKAISRKLKARNRTQAAMIARDAGLV